ncbi:MAG: ABC transporter ATP-binding protein [Anaerolineales bacterium]
MAVFAGLDSERYDRQYTDRQLFSRLWDYARDQKTRLLILTVAGLLVSFVLALVPIIIAAGVDALQRDAGTGELAALVVGLLVVGLLQYAGNWWRRRVSARMIGDLVARMRKDGFAAAIERDMAFYDENKTGKILSRITSDTESFAQVLIITSDLFSQIVQVVILLGVLVYLDIPLTLLLLLFMAPMLVTTVIFRTLARKVTRRGAQAMAEVNGNIQESVAGIGVAKNFRQEALMYNGFEGVNVQSYEINMQKGLVLAAIFPILNALAGIATAAIVYAGGLSTTQGIVSISVWYLYIQSVERFWFPVINLSSFWSQFQQAMSALERIFALIDAENSVQQTDKRPVDNLQGEIEFKNVQFAYKPGQPVLQDFNLRIAPGESVAFVGHTGAGKSSIVKLIMRLYEFQGGQILVDGQDIRGFDLSAYRGQLGFVPQAPFLFSGTVEDNIRYGKPDATREEIEEIAMQIGGGEWLETLPNGLQSDVGERGARLSLGQRQLVSLLRVLVHKPAIFVLDEATASIDNFTEVQIQEALEMILARSTSILIAHRLSTVRSADRIIVLRQGEIIEQGNHAQLMAQGGHYAELYDTYFRHQSMAYIDNIRDVLRDLEAEQPAGD